MKYSGQVRCSPSEILEWRLKTVVCDSEGLSSNSVDRIVRKRRVPIDHAPRHAYHHTQIMQMRKSLSHQADRYSPVLAEAYAVESLPPLAPSVMTESFRGSNRIKDFLSRKSWPQGLQNFLINGLAGISMRYFVCDDSGSMHSSDGHRIFGEGSAAKVISCSRWSEMTESLRFHVEMAEAAQSPTEFRMLNGSTPIHVGESEHEDEANVPRLMELFDQSPSGSTPLCFHVNQVINHITSIAPALRESGKKAAIIILTDGEASDGSIAETMRQLEKLPVWVVVRLCTDEDKMVNYWNNVDSEVELNMDVIDDHLGEAREIYKRNSWLTYGEPLHRLREFGVTAKEMDLIDERSLSREQMKLMMAFLFGVPARDLPDPAYDWEAFYKRIDWLNENTPLVLNPITLKMSKWIDMAALTRMYGPILMKCQCMIC